MYAATAAALFAMIGLMEAGTDGREKRVTQSSEANAEGEGIANLPFARGKRFRTLDEYLAHLEKQGAIDLPWWKRIGPDLYEKQTSLRRKPPETATREELLRRFGFRR